MTYLELRNKLIRNLLPPRIAKAVWRWDGYSWCREPVHGQTGQVVAVHHYPTDLVPQGPLYEVQRMFGGQAFGSPVPLYGHELTVEL